MKHTGIQRSNHEDGDPSFAALGVLVLVRRSETTSDAGGERRGTRGARESGGGATSASAPHGRRASTCAATADMASMADGIPSGPLHQVWDMYPLAGSLRPSALPFAAQQPAPSLRPGVLKTRAYSCSLRPCDAAMWTRTTDGTPRLGRLLLRDSSIWRASCRANVNLPSNIRCFGLMHIGAAGAVDRSPSNQR